MRWPGMGRWRTLGGLMLLIAALAVPLTMHGRHLRDVAARRDALLRISNDLSDLIDRQHGSRGRFGQWERPR